VNVCDEREFSIAVSSDQREAEFQQWK
jgi:hypothetical protein